MSPVTGMPAAAHNTTSGKRLPSNTEIESEPKSKRIRYTCGPPITVLAVRPENNVAALESEAFSLPPDLFIDFPACLQNKILQNPGQDKFEFNVYRKDFHAYLEWIQREGPTTIGAETGGAELLTWLGEESGDHDVHGETVLSLCRLYSTANEIDDQTFRNAILGALENIARGQEPPPACCGLESGEEYWKIASGLNLSPLADGRITSWVVGWVVRDLTREEIEKSSATLDSGYLETLRKIVLPKMVKIWFGTGKDQSMIMVNREMAISRSKAIFEGLAGKERVETLASKSIAVSPSGDIRLEGKYERSALEDWAQTLTSREHELKNLLSRHPGIGSNLRRIRNKAAMPLAEALAEVYAVAESVGDFKIQGLIVGAIIKFLVGRTTWISNKVKTSVTTNLPRENGLRRLLVDAMSAEFDHDGLGDAMETTPRALLDQVLVKGYEKRPYGGKFLEPQLSNLDKYCEPA